MELGLIKIKREFLKKAKVVRKTYDSNIDHRFFYLCMHIKSHE